ncbi:IS110 family transposase [Lacticaseibacillus zhaodongensis]|uniref:IS110 family transposase n=1 Tax=Lacticaseibacillus zhaodongensis TaxID=2668065 RepID=UPI0012D2C0BE|nr:IS110 family transposase [Lacticaseibacillus zhaodongensis]
MQSIVYVGMDVHKSTFSLCALNGETGEILGETQCASDPKLVVKFIDHLSDESEPGTAFKAGYEAGCLGYALRNALVRLGIDCVIMAPTTMYSQAKHTMVKNDKVDARMIATNLANHTYAEVYVPDNQDIEVKEYIRMRNDFCSALKRVKQQLSSLLLRQGFHYVEGSAWTEKHLKWIKGLKVSPLLRTTIDEYVAQLEEFAEKIKRFDQELDEIAHNDRYAEKVGELQCFKGIATTAAITLQVEIADFTRFPNARAFMNFIGMTPSDHSSGEHPNNKGGITKQGNTAVRTLLIECTRSLVQGHVGSKSKRVTRRQVNQSTRVIAYADRGTEHLQRKYQRMVARGKNSCVATAAVARELAGFVWGMETGHLD